MQALTNIRPWLATPPLTSVDDTASRITIVSKLAAIDRCIRAFQTQARRRHRAAANRLGTAIGYT